ncbi:unnamed protein product [Symbiodinium pilosum]|uniref:Uncharacterized protein n=1 Tax=Symbiodinium pilosum TaxID=2952 RepID=A0A812MD20_SYMPI|nr:unnamed protein product [Symbiodinium pilosum]
MAPMAFSASFAFFSLSLVVRKAAGHAMLTVPHSKNNGYPGSYALTRSEYYTTASWWLDRAFFEGDTKKTPWLKPGHFSWRDARDLYPDFRQVFHPCGCYNPCLCGLLDRAVCYVALNFLVLSSEGENILYGDGKERTYCMGMLQGLYSFIPY